MPQDINHTNNVNHSNAVLVTSNFKNKNVALTSKVNNESSKLDIKEIKNSYKDGFSVHGLTKIFTGHPVEQCLWFGLLLSCLIFVGRESYYFYAEYQRHDIRTEVRITTDKNMTLPVMTICGKNVETMISDADICWNNRSILDSSFLDDIPNIFPCNQAEPLIDSTYDNNGNMDVVGHPVYPACVIINSRARLRTLSANHLSIDSNDRPLYLYVHNIDDISFPLVSDLHKPAAIFTDPSYDIYVHFQHKKIFNRLKHPYPSNCTTMSSKKNLFGGIYTSNKCEETCAILSQVEACNATLDHWKPYLKNNKLFKAANDCYTRENDEPSKISECERKTRQCLWNLTLIPKECHCPTSCFEEVVDTIVTKTKDAIAIDLSMTNLHFSAGSTLTNITEIPAYPANKFITDIGGWLGLFSGMSVLSVAEIIIFLVLTITAFMKRNSRMVNPQNVS